MHRVAATPGEAGALSLAAGIDVELPHTRCYGEPLAEAVRAGAVPEELVDRAARRVLRQKAELGLLDPGWTSTVPDGPLDIDPPRAPGAGARAGRALGRPAGQRRDPAAARRQLGARRPVRRRPARRSSAATPTPTTASWPVTRRWGSAIEVPTLRDALEHAVYALGCDVLDDDPTGLAPRRSTRPPAPSCACAVVGDRAGLFGRGTSGEGCDAEDLSLPGIQDELVESLIETGTPIVLVVVSGRPYALGRYAGRAAAIVQAFMPGEEGAAAIAGVLTGDGHPDRQAARAGPARRRARSRARTCTRSLGGNSGGVSNLDPTPLFAFGHGLSYTTFEYERLRAERRGDRHRRLGRGLVRRAQQRASARARRSSSST